VRRWLVSETQYHIDIHTLVKQYSSKNEILKCYLTKYKNQRGEAGFQKLALDKELSIITPDPYS
jgi:hypothetical protein